MTAVTPAPIVTGERHFRGNPVASLVRASDFGLLVPEPEIVIVGSAFAEPGQRSRSIAAQLALQRDDRVLLRKRLEVFGDRRAPVGAPVPEPIPFERVPIQYERALGGFASRENPVGVGMQPDDDGMITYPNIELPSSGGVSPAGFGPIPSAWPARQKRRGSMPWSAANTHLDVDVPDDFDDAYFQTAPSDQRVSELVGGELLAIVNMHPEIATLRTYLPHARGVAIVQTASGERVPLALRIDTLHVEPDAMRAELVFRGALPLEARHRGQLWLGAALARAGEHVDFPDLSTQQGSSRSAPAVQASAELTSTVVLDPTQPLVPTARVGEPLARGQAGTVIIEPRPPPNQRATALIEPDAAPSSLPFGKRDRGRGAQVAAVRTDVGTPWGPAPAPVRPASPLLSATVVHETEAPPEAGDPRPADDAASASGSAQPNHRPLATPAEAPPLAPAKGGNPWREDPVPAAPLPVAPTRPAALPRADFKAGALKKFKGGKAPRS